jgi:hypothetical protein
MTYTEYKETKQVFEEKVIGFYGSIQKQDMQDFIEWLQNDEELNNEGWGLGEPLPFDIEDLLDEYITQEPHYKPF